MASHSPQTQSLSPVECTLGPTADKGAEVSESGDCSSRSTDSSPQEVVAFTLDVQAANFLYAFRSLAYADARFSLRELEEIYLARRCRELSVESGKQEEELGRHLTSCMRAINKLHTLRREMYMVRDRQERVSNGASRLRSFEYEWEMQHRIAIFNAATASFLESRPCHQPTPISRKLRLLGHAFYIEPSLLSVSFNRLWNRLWASSQS